MSLGLEMKGLGARRRDRLLELDEVERRLKPFGRRYLGVREIPLDATRRLKIPRRIFIG